MVYIWFIGPASRTSIERTLTNNTHNTSKNLKQHNLVELPDALCDQIQLLSSDNPELQSLFANGLLWCYGFHHEQAELHFRELLNRESNNLLGLWGLAYACMPFYNRPWSWFTDKQKQEVAKLGFSCVQTGKKLVDEPACKNQLIAKQLLNAQELLFRSNEPVSDETFDAYHGEYAQQMMQLARKHPDQPDVVALACEALMNCTPWQLWNIDDKNIANGSQVEQVLKMLQPLLADLHPAKSHPGILHLHIHALEMSPYPQQAAASAQGIRQLVLALDENATSSTKTSATHGFPPHLPHMASHIDVLQGDYQSAIDINRKAANADEHIAAVAGEFYQISRLHNAHMMLYAAMMAGRQADAEEAQNRLESLATRLYVADGEDYLKVSIEGFFANRLHAAVRFGRWQEILDRDLDYGKRDWQAEQIANAQTLESLPYTAAMQSYTRGVALANTGKPQDAEKELALLKQISALVPEWYLISNNPARDILKVAQLMLSGEHQYHAGNIDSGLDALRKAVAACDELAYCEPWGWMHPPRHALGALLLEQGQIEEAQEVYETDLGLNDRLPVCKKNPENIWALHGLHECLTLQKLQSDTEKINASLQAASSYADIAISSSCFCSG